MRFLILILLFSQCSSPAKRTTSDNTLPKKDITNIDEKKVDVAKFTEGDSLPDGTKADEYLAPVAVRDSAQEAIAIARLVQWGNEEKLREYVHPEIGIYAVTNPGAFPVMYHLEQFDELMATTNLMMEGREPVCANPVRDTLPSTKCDSEFGVYDKRGCYYQWHPEAIFQYFYEVCLQVDAATPEMDFMESLGIDQPEITVLENAIEFGIYDTDSALGVYLGRIDGKWYILGIDRVDPCMA